MPTRILILIFFLLVCSVRLAAKEYPLIHYTVEDGLPSNVVYETYRDSKGFLWIGTDKGVSRYNGIKFENFTTLDGLSDNEVFFFNEDRQGRLWMATYNGTLCYYQNDTFHTAKNTPWLKLPFKPALINCINICKDSSIVFYFFFGEKFVSLKNNSIKTIDIRDISTLKELGDDGISEIRPIVDIIKLSENDYEITKARSKVHVDSTGKVISNKVFDQYMFISYTHGQKYLENSTGIYSMDWELLKPFSTNVLKHVLRKEPGIYMVYMNDQFVFVPRRGGGVIISPLYEPVIDDKISILNNENITTVGQDIHGNYWLNTLNNGIYVLKNNFYRSEKYTSVYPGHVNYSAYVNKHIVFATSDNSLQTLSRGKVICLFRDRANLLPPSYYPLHGGAFVDKENNFYSVYDKQAYQVKDIFSSHPRTLVFRNTRIGHGNKKMLVKDGVATMLYPAGIQTLDFKKAKPGDDVSDLACFVVGPANSFGKVFATDVSPTGEVWFSVPSGIYKICANNAVSQRQFGNLCFKNFVFFRDKIIGYTHNNELLICSNIDEKVKVDSISSAHCIWEKMYPLDSNHLLVSTNGLYRLFTFSGYGNNYRMSINIVEDPYIPHTPEAICSDSTQCYFFSEGNIVSFPISNLTQKVIPPKVYFKHLKIQDSVMPVSSLINISYRQSRSITISYGALLFSGKDAFYQYSTSTDGVDHWRPIVGDINLVNPGWGEYAVKVRARTMSSEYGEPVIVVLNISKPFWASWWSIGLMALIVVVITIFVVRLRFKATLKRNLREHDDKVKFMKAEYKALNALMNPHFIFNTLNNVQGLVNRNDKTAANEYLRDFADIIRQNMHNVSRDTIPLQKEVDLVSNYLRLEKLRFKDFLNYHIDIAAEVDLSDIFIPPLLIQPLVENAIKHGIYPRESPDSLVLIDIFEKGDLLHIRVRDNGVGLSHTATARPDGYQSYGLENIRKRIEQLSVILGKQITFDITDNVEEQGQCWTVALVTIPL